MSTDTNKPFNKMNKTELVASAQALKLEDKVKEIAKDPENPINAEYVTVLEEFKASQAEANGVDDKPMTPDAKPGKVAKATEAEKVAYNETAFYYLVTDHDTSVSIDDDEENRVYEFRWGNSRVGMTTQSVKLNGEPQYLPRGAVKTLERITYTKHYKVNGKPAVKEVPRFKITEMPEGWSLEEFEAKKRDQMTQKSAAGQL